MADPFLIHEPTAIGFSGGRTSGYMLWRVLQANGGLPPGCVVQFNNTGKEEPETLEFVRDVAVHWGIPIHWLEWRLEAPGFAVVDFDTASRNGEPFEACILNRQYLPNPVTRFCTAELKIRTARKHLQALGWEGGAEELENVSWVGIRADEPRRAAKIKDKGRIPLWHAGVTKEEVNAFWLRQPFTLELPTVNGRTLAGNCDLCFLKPPAQRLSLIAQKPERAVWWARMEASGIGAARGARFTKDGPSYGELQRYAAAQVDAFATDDEEEALACFCGD